MRDYSIWLGMRPLSCQVQAPEKWSRLRRDRSPRCTVLPFAICASSAPLTRTDCDSRVSAGSRERHDRALAIAEVARRNGIHLRQGRPIERGRHDPDAVGDQISDYVYRLWHCELVANAGSGEAVSATAYPASTAAFRSAIASTKSSLNSCTTVRQDLMLSIRPTPCPTK
jgi:hypothetical protein